MRNARDQVALDAVPELIAGEALLKEFEFVESLIPLYRGFEVQTLHLSVIIFAGAAGFSAAAIERSAVDLLAYLIPAMVPWPMAILLLLVAGMEARIVRASNHVSYVISPRLQTPQGDPVLRWETSPGTHLTVLQRNFISSWPYALAIGAQGALGGTLGIVGGVQLPEHRTLLLTTSISGLVAMTAAALLVCRMSRKHESR